jgi:cytochrome c peroxidase
MRRSGSLRSQAGLLPPNDTGRFTVSKAQSDEYLSKVSTLRNIALTDLAPYVRPGNNDGG